MHSELRLFQALSNVTTSSLSDLLISPQIHNYTIDYSKVNLKHFNINVSNIDFYYIKILCLYKHSFFFLEFGTKR